MSAPSLTALTELARLLDAALRGAALQRLRDPDPHTLALKLRVPGHTYFLTLSARPDAPGVKIGREQPPTLPEPHGVGRWARAHLEGARVEGVEVVGEDRVLALRTRAGALYLELLPSRENLYAVDLEGRVRAWLHKTTGRELSLGQPWRPPARSEGFEQARETRSAPPAAPLTGDEARALLEPLIEAAQARAEEAGDDRASREARERVRLIKQVRARLTRLSEALWGDIGRADEAATLGRHAELLKGRLRDLRRGLTSVRVTDWFDPELREVEIPLDPKLDGLENMERLFQRQRKALRGAEMATARLEETERQLVELDSIVEERAEEPLEALRVALRVAGLLRERAQGGQGGQGAGQKGNASAARKPYRVFHSAQGEVIWLGRGGGDNHATTFQHARGQDHWVHTRDVPGAHVIIPLPRRGHTPHPETVLDAAALAVHHSSQRGEQGVPVYHTERKHVRPVPGGPPGKVMVADSRALTATEVEARVERLYAEAQRRGDV
jgi:predicted ribosome quality control (RQC) complex YloA/Tae2 family protein